MSKSSSTPGSCSFLRRLRWSFAWFPSSLDGDVEKEVVILFSASPSRLFRLPQHWFKTDTVRTKRIVEVEHVFVMNNRLLECARGECNQLK